MIKKYLALAPPYLLVLSLPFYFIRFSLFGLPTNLLEMVFFGFLLVWLLSFRLSRAGDLAKLVTTSSLFLPSLVFLISGVVSIFVSTDWYKSLGLFRAYFLEPVIVYLILVDLGSKWGFAQVSLSVRRSLYASGILVSLYGLYQFLTGSNVIAPLEAAQGRITSFFNHPNFLALFLGPIILLLLSEFKTSQKQSKKWLLGTLLTMFSIIFILTGSVGGYVGLAISVLTIGALKLYARSSQKIQKFSRYIVGAVLGLGILTLVVFYANISEFTPNNGLVWPRPNPSTSVIRLCVWEGAKRLLSEDFLLGVGLGGFYRQYPEYRTCDTELFVYPHNIFLNLWSELGLLGLLSFFWLVLVQMKILTRNLNLEKSVLIAALVYWLVHGLVDVPYFKNDISILFWLIAALITFKEMETRKN